MTIAAQLKAVELLLASITWTMGEDGAEASFMYGRPGAPPYQLTAGATIYYHHVPLMKAALFVRKEGSAHLRFLPVSYTIGKLQAFMSDFFW